MSDGRRVICTENDQGVPLRRIGVQGRREGGPESTNRLNG